MNENIINNNMSTDFIPWKLSFLHLQKFITEKSSGRYQFAFSNKCKLRKKKKHTFDYEHTISIIDNLNNKIIYLVEMKGVYLNYTLNPTTGLLLNAEEVLKEYSTETYDAISRSLIDGSDKKVDEKIRDLGNLENIIKKYRDNPVYYDDLL